MLASRAGRLDLLRHCVRRHLRQLLYKEVQSNENINRVTDEDIQEVHMCSRSIKLDGVETGKSTKYEQKRHP